LLQRYGIYDNCQFFTLLNKPTTKEVKDQVVLLGVFADRSNRGNQELRNFLPIKVNGKKIKDFKSFYKYILSLKDGFIVLENENARKVIIDVKEALQRHKQILQTYNIEFDHSKDLDGIK